MTNEPDQTAQISLQSEPPSPPNKPGPQFMEKLKEKLKAFEPALMVDWAAGVFQGQGRKNTVFYGKLATLLLCTYFLADLTAIALSKYLPEPPAPRRNNGGFHHMPSLEDYNVIFARNLFNSNGVIPGEEQGPQDLGGVPVRTTLPFDLIGTMILQDELRSIATIEDKSASTVYPVRETDEIPQKARIIKIEPKRVIFVNTASGRREFIDLPENAETTAPRISLGSKSGGGAGIEQTAPTQFAVSRNEVDKAMGDLNNILTQARAVPHFENGVPAGYKLFQIVPGSIYSKLGLKDGDIISGFNGQPANDPAIAFQQLSDIKNQSHLDLQIKRDGKPVTFSYDFK